MENNDFDESIKRWNESLPERQKLRSMTMRQLVKHLKLNIKESNDTINQITGKRINLEQ